MQNLNNKNQIVSNKTIGPALIGTMGAATVASIAYKNYKQVQQKKAAAAAEDKQQKAAAEDKQQKAAAEQKKTVVTTVYRHTL